MVLNETNQEYYARELIKETERVVKERQSGYVARYTEKEYKRYLWARLVLSLVRDGLTPDCGVWPTAPTGLSTRYLLDGVKGPYRIWNVDAPTAEIVIRRPR